MHQKQILKLIDRSSRKRKIPKYTKIVFSSLFFLGIFSLIIAIIFSDLTFLESIPFAGIVLLMSLVIAFTSSALNGKNADFDTESIVLDESHITFKSEMSTSNFEIPIQNGLKIIVEYFGTDEGPQHWINYSRHKTGGNNFIIIQTVAGTIFKKGVLLQK
jgi:hypothetical protein